jgi:hypothetical protein
MIKIETKNKHKKNELAAITAGYCLYWYTYKEFTPLSRPIRELRLTVFKSKK